MAHTIPGGRQEVVAEDIQAVAAALSSDWLTTGPKVAEFESCVAAITDARHGVAVCNGTAALHTLYAAFGLSQGDEVIVPAITFAATSNAALYLGARPVFADVTPETLLVDPRDVEKKITRATKAIVAVDYAGQPCDYSELRKIADNHGLALFSDACHSLGASYQNRPVGSLADATVFSFHPVKPITTGEGGMVVTNDTALADRMRKFRNHGIGTEFRERESQGTWDYSVEMLGFNYRLSDVHSALGLSQLSRLESMVARRNRIASKYRAAMQEDTRVTSLSELEDRTHGYHLFVVRLRTDLAPIRRGLFAAAKERGIRLNVHYLPVYQHPYYQNLPREFPPCAVAESVYSELISLPIYPTLTDAEAEYVIEEFKAALNQFTKS